MKASFVCRVWDGSERRHALLIQQLMDADVVQKQYGTLRPPGMPAHSLGSVCRSPSPAMLDQTPGTTSPLVQRSM